MHNDPDDERWTRLVQLLHEDAEDLVAEFMRQVLAIPPYATGVVPRERVEADAVASFDYLLRRVGGLPLPDRVRRIGPAVGRDRARRGVPLEDLITAVRLDFRVLWAALRARVGPADVPVLVNRVEEMWVVIEEFITTVQVSYLE
ncbi:MAG: helix-turn-helix domain-containing protein, partial [Thermocrispum sp.]